MNALQPWHIIVVALIFLILFGSKRLPDAARGVGRSLRIFKSEVKEMQNDSKPDQDKDAAELDPQAQIISGAGGAPHSFTETEEVRRV